MDFLKGEEPTDVALEKLERLAHVYQTLEEDIKQKEEELAERKKAFMAISQVEIPELLHEYGLSEIKLKNKKKIIVKENVSVSVPDEKDEAFNAFLKQKGAEDLVKLQISFGRMPVSSQRALFAFLQANEYEFDSKKGVHPMTLKKFVGDLLGLDVTEDERAEGIKQGIYMRTQELMDVMNVYTFFSTKIKEPK
jgi:hypothetical protein